MNTEVLLLSGSSGTGKTSIANEISEQLSTHGIPHANIDGDNLDAIYPEETGPEMMLSNLEAMWGNYYRQRGCRRLVLSGTAMVLEHGNIQRTIKQIPSSRASPGLDERSCDLKVHGIILTADHAVVSDRLRMREIGSTLNVHLSRSQNMASVLEKEVGDWACRIPTDGRSVKDIALHALKHIGWII